MRAFRLVFDRLKTPGPAIPIAMATLVLGVAATRAILLQTGGEPAVPLDDAFIHFQFSRTFAELRPLQYNAGAPAVPGATSLLWPMVLAPFHWVGLGGVSLIWVAWILGYAALAGLGYETWRAAQGLLSRESAITAAAMVFAFGGFTWFASSGMEVVPFAWLLMRSARRTAQWAEQPNPATNWERAELLALAILAPMMRPEGVIATALVVGVLARFRRGGALAWALVPMVGPLVPGAVNLALTGQWVTTTARAKWLLYTPYPHRIPATLRYHLDVFFNTLLDGRVWSSVFLPRGIKWLVWFALPALLFAGAARQRWVRAVALTAVGLGMLLPTTYDSFLVNRLRYLWPFAAAWFVGMGALADGVGAALARWRDDLAGSRYLVGGVFVGALAAHLPATLDDLAVSADAIRRQQVSMARWIATELPKEAIVGVNDAGAITYLSGRRTFDLVGLTSRGEARYWAAGPGSRFEHYEHLGADRLPTHFAVYDSWVGIPPLMGEYLTSRTVTGATILGDATKTAYVARYDSLNSGNLPLEINVAGEPVDRLDIADLVSESDHDYQLFWATQQDDIVLEDSAGHVDGGRANRVEDRFKLELRSGGKLVARVASRGAGLSVLVDGKELGRWRIGGSTWEEHALTVPPELGGQRVVRVVASGQETFTSLHYWAFP